MAKKNEIQQAQTEAIAPRQSMTPGQMATALLEREDFDVEKLARLMELQQQHEANEARKAYIQAMTIFRAECPTIKKTKTVSYGSGQNKTQYRHSDLASTDEQIRPLLSQCQLSRTWRVVRDEPAWIVVECVLSHIGGHSEKTQMGGPPDTSGSKNALQARASTVKYLERYTSFALLGLVDKDMPDDDGAGGAEPEKPLPTGTDAEKRAFMAACKKAGGPEKPSGQQCIDWLKKAQQLSGEDSIAGCAKWVKEHGEIRDGVLALALPQDAEQEPDPLAEPDIPHEEPNPETMPFVCEKCGTLYRVKPARSLCVVEGAEGACCGGKVVDREVIRSSKDSKPMKYDPKQKCICDEKGHKFDYGVIQRLDDGTEVCPVCLLKDGVDNPGWHAI